MRVCSVAFPENAMKPKILVLSVLSALLAGVAVVPMLGHFGMQFAFPGHEDQTWSAAPSGSLSDLNTIANDITQPTQRRAEAVFGLFAHHVSCGMTAADMGKILGSNTWLSQASLDVPQVLGGAEPVNTEHGTWVQMDLFSGDPAKPHWIVHFSLEGDGEVIDARRFFEGFGECIRVHKNRGSRPRFSASLSGWSAIEEGAIHSMVSFL